MIRWTTGGSLADVHPIFMPCTLPFAVPHHQHEPSSHFRMPCLRRALGVTSAAACGATCKESARSASAAVSRNSLSYVIKFRRSWVNAVVLLAVAAAVAAAVAIAEPALFFPELLSLLRVTCQGINMTDDILRSFCREDARRTREHQKHALRRRTPGAVERERERPE